MPRCTWQAADTRILHGIVKKTAKTPKANLDLARERMDAVKARAKEQEKPKAKAATKKK